jgi:hypothetical protein
MSSGFLGSLVPVVNANIRLDTSGMRCTLASEVDIYVEAGETKKATFTVIVPVHVGFEIVKWGDILAAGNTVDYVGWMSNGELVSNSTLTSELCSDPQSHVLALQAEDALAGTPKGLFRKFTVVLNLENKSEDVLSCNQLIVGFTFPSLKAPRAKGIKFNIYASLKVETVL